MSEAPIQSGEGKAFENERFSDAEGGSDDEEKIEDEEEEVDPRVQGELETLNNASDEINTLERELEKSRNKFRALLAESTQQLNALFKKLGKAVLKARSYYELSKSSKEAQAEAQKAAVNFQRSNSVYRAAKEMVQLAEERNFPEDGDKRAFDSAWQEMLNHATMKFTESEKEKAESEQNHLIKAAEYAAIQQKLRFYEKDMPRTIKKAKPYFDLKERLEKHLQNERVNVEDLQMGLVCAKHKYRSALTNLEAISEEIHQKRKKRLNLPARTPGVGAESISDLSSLPSCTLDNLSDNISFASMDDLDADGASLKGELPDYEKPRGFSDPPPRSSTPTGISVMEKSIEKVKLADISPDIGMRESVAEGSESLGDSHRETKPSPQATLTYKSTVNIGPLTTPGQSYKPSQPPGVSYYRRGNTPIGAGVAMGVSEASFQAAATSKNPPSRREQKKIQTQMAFPILAGLTSTQNSMGAQYGNRYAGNMYPRVPSPYVNMPPTQRPSASQGSAVAVEDGENPMEKPTEKPQKKEEVFV